MTMKFCEVPVGARFEFRGQRYQKLALSMACDEQRWGNIFHDDTEVVAEGELLPVPSERGAGERGSVNVMRDA